MMEILKKTLLAGVGATVVTKERVEASLNELVEKGRLSAEEARKTADKIVAEGKSEYDQARGSLQKLFDEFLEQANVARQKEVTSLEKRLGALEVKVAAMESEEDADSGTTKSAKSSK